MKANLPGAVLLVRLPILSIFLIVNSQLSINLGGKLVSFAEIIGHNGIVKALKASLLESKTGHAYLFLGPAGIGKKTLSRAFAAGLLCPNHSGECSSECQSCSQFSLGAHPDFLTVTPSGNSIKIEQLRELQRNAYLRPLLGERKVFFFPEAEQLTEAAANSFLKILEEPPKGVVFLFTAVRSDNILPTIRSRCQVFQLFPVPPTQIAIWLKSKGFSEAEAAGRSIECQGLPGIAVSEKDINNPNRIDFMEIMAYDLLQILKFTTELEKKERREILALLQDWSVQVRNLILQTIQSVNKNHPKIGQLVRISEKLTQVTLMIENNVNIRLAIEEFFLTVKMQF